MKKELLFLLIVPLLFSSCSNSDTKDYIVSWVNYDNTLLLTEKYKEGEIPFYKGATPTKDGDEEHSYLFDGWNPDVVKVTTDVVYKARFLETINEYTVCWFDYDNTLLLEEKYNYGELPSYKGSNPTRTSDDQYEYVFAGWSPTIKKVTGNQDYFASYNHNKKEYTITWKNYDGYVLSVEKYNYGDLPSFKLSNPQKPSNNQYYYSFLGWDKEIASVTCNQEYIAVFEERFGFDFNYINSNEAEITKCFLSDLDTIEVPGEIENHLVTRLCKDVFKNFDKVKTILLPSSLTVIEKAAFSGNNVLESIAIPFVGRSKGSGFDYFGYIFGSGSYQYTKYIPKSLKEVTILDGCTRIGENAFYNCSNITNIIIPNSISIIGENAFYGCSSLNYNSFDNICYLGNSSNKYLVLVKVENNSIESCTINRDCKIVIFNAFSGCSQLTSLSIPFIGESLEKNTYLGYLFGAKSYKENGSLVPKSLQEVEITSPCSIISEQSFYGCSSLKRININEGTTAIRDYAFADCTSLCEISIPESIKSIGQFVFYNCDLLRFSLFDNAKYLGNSENEFLWLVSKVDQDIQSIAIHAECKHICSSAFSGCYNLTKISIPEGILSIGYGAFQNCRFLSLVVIPKSIVNIEEYSFNSCDSLARVFYDGLANDWLQINISINNDKITNVDRYYYSDVEPIETGNYWHYINGEPTIWQMTQY